MYYSSLSRGLSTTEPRKVKDPFCTRPMDVDLNILWIWISASFECGSRHPWNVVLRFLWKWISAFSGSGSQGPVEVDVPVVLDVLPLDLDVLPVDLDVLPVGLDDHGSGLGRSGLGASSCSLCGLLSAEWICTSFSRRARIVERGVDLFIPLRHF